MSLAWPPKDLLAHLRMGHQDMGYNWYYHWPKIIENFPLLEAGNVHLQSKILLLMMTVHDPHLQV